ncbi:MAG: 23S rRNA (adenine(2503)-C(2))-methyltransferase RlmN [Armatimonadetes bacterium]|nr:23S rRNA (adenine(2503)-C(2))-methyltransferase RlmN [Armatimonadota bacterium]
MKPAPFSISITAPDGSVRQSLLGMDRAELEAVVAAIGQPTYRANQLHEWLYRRHVDSVMAITSLSHELRGRLAETATLRTLTLADQQTSTDGTIKFLFRTHDGYNIESVLIPSEARDDQDEPKRRTICISTQVGCPLDCKFCATASMKLKRNLAAGEIIEQFLRVQDVAGQKITNIVFMGMGEPMLNYDAVFRAVALFADPGNDLVPAARITVSTSGLVEGIRRMADEGQKIKLALSLHASTNGLRSELMPINRRHDLTEVMDAVEYYYRKTRRTVTFEYILFEGLNDTEEDARRIAKLTRRVPSKVNIIPFHSISFTNPTGISARLHPTTRQQFDNFVAMLRAHGAQVMVRSSSGQDIEAACGQLAVKHGAERLE